jgi:hypothetical protein
MTLSKYDTHQNDTQHTKHSAYQQSIITFSMMGLIATFSIYDTQYNDTHHIDTQHNDTQHIDTLHNGTQ